jgi:hypothetical protein
VKVSLVCCFINTVPVTVQALVVARGMFTDPWHTEYTFLLCQPCDGGMFDVFILGGMSDRCSLKAGNRWKSLCEIQTIWGMVLFPTELLQQVLSLLCCEQSGIVIEENHTIAKKTGTLFPAHQKHITLHTSKQEQFSKSLMLNCCSYAPVHVPWIMTVNTGALCCIYQQHLKFTWVQHVK